MSFRFGGIKMNEMHFGNKKVTEVYFGVNKIYPEKQPEPQPAIAYVISNILIHMSSGDKIKVNGSNYAFITANVAEYHDGVLYDEYPETVTSFVSNPKFIVNGDRLSYNVQDYGRIETSTQNVNVQFTLHNNTYTVAMPVEANIATVQNLIALYATSTPSSAIIPQGERIYLYPEYRKTVRTSYTSGIVDETPQGKTWGTCNIYFKLGDEGEELWGDDVSVSTQTYDIPANRTANNRNIQIRIVPSTVEGEDYAGDDLIINLTQNALPRYNINWNINNLDYMLVSLSYDRYVPVPSQIIAGDSIAFYIREIEDCDVSIKQNGIDITEYQQIVWEDDTTMLVIIEDVQGNLDITLDATPIVPPMPVTKYRINQDICVQCGNCLDACRFGAVSETDNVYTINPIKCVGCGECIEVCPIDGAIEEYEA